MFLFFGGIIFALFGVLGCADLVQKKKKCTEETTAIVTEISKEIDNDNNLSYWPIIEYNINMDDNPYTNANINNPETLCEIKELCRRLGLNFSHACRLLAIED